MMASYSAPCCSSSNACSNQRSASSLLRSLAAILRGVLLRARQLQQLADLFFGEIEKQLARSRLQFLPPDLNPDAPAFGINLDIFAQFGRIFQIPFERIKRLFQKPGIGLFLRRRTKRLSFSKSRNLYWDSSGISRWRSQLRSWRGSTFSSRQTSLRVKAPPASRSKAGVGCCEPSRTTSKHDTTAGRKPVDGTIFDRSDRLYPLANQAVDRTSRVSHTKKVRYWFLQYGIQAKQTGVPRNKRWQNYAPASVVFWIGWTCRRIWPGV